MEHMVYTVFKWIMVSMILVFVFDMLAYLVNCFIIESRMQNIMQSMQNVVSENNYLPAESYNMYKDLFILLINQMNGQTMSTTLVDYSGQPNWFVKGISTNYNHDAVNCISSFMMPRNGTNTNVLIKQMHAPAGYGDIMVVQASVGVIQPVWDFVGATQSAATWTNSDNSPALIGNVKTFEYTYYVPCLNFRKDL